MTLHIKRVVAAMAAVLMLLTLVPTAALPTIQLPDLSSESNEAMSSTDLDTTTDAPDSGAQQNAVTDKTVTMEDLLASDEGVVIGDDGTMYVDSNNDGIVEAIKGDTIEDDENFDPSEELEELTKAVKQGKVEETDTYYATEEDAAASAASPYLPLDMADEEDPFLPGGDAWINQDMIYYGAPASPTYPFTDWAANTSFLNTSVKEYNQETGRAKSYVFPDVDLIDANTFGPEQKAGTEADGFAYNRFDAAYDKYGVTFDRNRTTTEWTLSKDVRLSETPYLAFSIEQVDEAKMAIAVHIGTPKDPTDLSKGYDYRWYTITDNNDHLGINYEETKENTVMPDVQISADAPIFNDAYTTGALTGCIDMVYWLPQLDTNLSSQTVFHIDKVQVSKTGQASRINYLYFLNQASTILSPQVNTGSTDLGGVSETETYDTATGDDLNGWRNADAVSIKMLGNSNYSMTIDSNKQGVEMYEYTAWNGNEEYKGMYFDVVIPVRKWLNFSADSRTVLVEMYNDSTSNEEGITGKKEIEFSMWGNNTGGTPLKYRDDVFQSHNSNEDLLFITGCSTDALGQPYCYPAITSGSIVTLEIDKKYNSYFGYGKANLFDFIQSPYMKESVYVADPADPRYGWAYVSSMRITVPVNTGTYKINAVQTRPIEDGLNDFTKVNGVMVPDENSMDGGTGVQPVVEPGTKSTEPAAFGPHYYSSEYKITDLLNHDTTLNNNGESSDDTSAIFGMTAKYVKNGNAGAGFGTRPCFYGTAETYIDAATFESSTIDKYVTFYAKTTIQGLTYYATPIIYGEGKGEMKWAWAYYDDFTTVSTASGAANDDGLIDLGTFDSYSQGFQVEYPKDEDWQKAIYEKLQDEWVWSNLIDAGGHFTLDSTRVATRFDESGEFAPVPLAFITDRWASSFNGSNVTYLGKQKLAPWKTDFEFSNAPTTSNDQINANRIRILADPVRVTKDDYLYVDIERDSNVTNTIQLLVGGKDGVVYIFNVDVGNQAFEGFSKRGSGINIPKGTWSVRIPFDDIFNVLPEKALYDQSDAFDGTGTYADVIGVALGSYSDSATTYKTMFRRLEVHSCSMKFKDRIETRETENDEGEIITEYVDGFNVLEDACNETYTYEINKAEQGRRGWSINSAMSKNLQGFVFRPTLGHYRISKTDETDGQLVLESDRSFSVNDYKYLYLSVSMRNTSTGYGLEPEASNPADNNGVSVILKQYSGDSQANTNIKALVLDATTKQFKLKENYKSADVSPGYVPSLNTAIDLSQTNLTSLSQIVFRFKGPSTVEGTTGKVYYYINYLYLSNVPPTPGFEERVVNRGFYHNYYLMDNSGGRYSRRFPTVDNPSGQVTSSDPNAANGRVNPLIIARGQQFWTGTYYNGTPLDEFTTLDGKTKYTVNGDRDRVISSVLFYHDHKDEDDGSGNTGDHLIDQYYKDAPGTFTFQGTEYDSYWCYNRWTTEWALDRYVAFSATTHKADGPLMDLHATANNVFLRNGIQPVKYQTTFDTQGGQMVYSGSVDINTDNNGLIENENNYYITEATITDYYAWPTTDGRLVQPQKFGYEFKGWYTERDGKGEQKTPAKTKNNPWAETFYAHWTPIEGTPTYTAKFMKYGKDDANVSEDVWFSRTAQAPASQPTGDEYTIIIPWVTEIITADGRVPLVGWTVSGDESGKVYTPGMKLTVTQDVTFLPYTDTESEVSLTITVGNNAKLCLYKDSMEEADLTEITNGYKGIVVTVNGKETTYTNIPRYTVLVAKPDEEKTDYGWKVTNEGYSSYSVQNGRASEAAASKDTYYRFAAQTDATLNYVPLSYGQDENSALIWTAPEAYVANRQMMFYSQFDLPDDATPVSYGTLYTKDTQVGTLSGWGDSDASKATALGNAMQFTSADCKATTSSAVRYVQATEKNDTNQYYLMVTENKGNSVTYYARGYVQYTLAGDTTPHVAYSDIISVAGVDARIDPLAE